MINHSEKIKTYTDAYYSGIYTKDEAIGAFLGLFAEVSDVRALWSEIPDWAQMPIQEYLKSCDDSAVLYDSSSKNIAPIDPRLLELKRWLASK
ncbi:hypothetical protein [Variovorax sp. tm]|uniref:hypothetical protein n=1 Tax=Variovorax atrisoli TaxID=3394203 RepID=UPI003A809CB0